MHRAQFVPQGTGAGRVETVIVRVDILNATDDDAEPSFAELFGPTTIHFVLVPTIDLVALLRLMTYCLGVPPNSSWTRRRPLE
jgi:hypothetical protein